MTNISENASIAVLQNEMKTLSATTARIETKLDTQSSMFLTRNEFNEFKARWFLSHTMAGLAGAVLTGVTIYILTHYK